MALRAMGPQIGNWAAWASDFWAPPRWLQNALPPSRRLRRRMRTRLERVVSHVANAGLIVTRAYETLMPDHTTRGDKHW